MTAHKMARISYGISAVTREIITVTISNVAAAAWRIAAWYKHGWRGGGKQHHRTRWRGENSMAAIDKGKKHSACARSVTSAGNKRRRSARSMAASAGNESISNGMA